MRSLTDRRPMPSATTSDLTAFQAAIREDIPDILPPARPLDPGVSHAPKRKDILSAEEKKLALRNALHFFANRRNGTGGSTRWRISCIAHQRSTFEEATNVHDQTSLDRTHHWCAE